MRPKKMLVNTLPRLCPCHANKFPQIQRTFLSKWRYICKCRKCKGIWYESPYYKEVIEWEENDKLFGHVIKEEKQKRKRLYSRKENRFYNYKLY